MPQLRFSRQVSCTPGEMFDLVADVAAYPAFVPNCTSMDVKPVAEGVVHARMGVKFGPIKDAYTSEVKMDRSAGTITARALDGPFSHLDSRWTFTQVGQGTDAQFEIDFGFSNPLIAAVAEPAFASKQEEIMAAFLKRAEALYGPSSSPTS